MAHEYGHALGLGHSSSPATMQPSVSAGSTAIRSIESDDIAGIQCIYGVQSATKPTIVATVASGGSLTIYGTNFTATDNDVWFTHEGTTATNVDPRVRVQGLTSSNGGTVITVAIPAEAGPGDVLVKKSGAGNATLSNAFPTDLVGTFGNPPNSEPDITNVTPSTIDALIPGTIETVTLTGTNFLLVTDVLLDGVAIDPSRYTVLNASTITLDMPQANGLGVRNLGVTDGVNTDTFPITIVVPSSPKYELGTGDQLNVVDRDNGLPFIVCGDVGSLHYVYASPSNLPSSNAFASFDIGNNFTQLTLAGIFTIPAKGWFSVLVPTSALPNPGAGSQTWYSQSLELDGSPAPFPSSNFQSIVLVQ
jgi:hypothetical protein